MYTVILLLRKFANEKYANKFFKKYHEKKYFNKIVSPMINRYCKNLFIFRYDELMELYKLLDSTQSNDIIYLLDDEYDYITIVLEEKDILKIRIDISISSRNVKLSIDEIALKYSLRYEFKDKIRFRTYHEETKDKDQQLISVSNDLLVSVYSKLLRRLFWNCNLTNDELIDVVGDIKNVYDYDKLDKEN